MLYSSIMRNNKTYAYINKLKLTIHIHSIIGKLGIGTIFFVFECTFFSNNRASKIYGQIANSPI